MDEPGSVPPAGLVNGIVIRRDIFLAPITACFKCASPLSHPRTGRPRKFCVSCAQPRRKWNGEERVCEQCGVKFKVRHMGSRHCSRACQYGSRAISLAAFTCSGCGRSSMRQPKRIRDAYCGVECRNRAKSLANRKEKACAECGSRFLPDFVAKGKQKYCQKKCAVVAWTRMNRTRVRHNHRQWRARQPIQVVMCGICGVPCPPGRRTFCSDRCSEKARCRRKRLGRKRQRALKRVLLVKVPCEICGFSDHTDRCHIVERSKGGPMVPWNVLRLCPNHHWKFDHGRLSLDELNALGIGFLAA